MAEKLATLTFSDGTPAIDFPVMAGAVGPDVIDIRPLYAKIDVVPTEATA